MACLLSSLQNSRFFSFLLHRRIQSSNKQSEYTEYATNVNDGVARHLGSFGLASVRRPAYDFPFGGADSDSPGDL